MANKKWYFLDSLVTIWFTGGIYAQLMDYNIELMGAFNANNIV